VKNPRTAPNPSTIVNRTVTPRRPRNADLREREYLTPKETPRGLAGRVMANWPTQWLAAGSVLADTQRQKKAPDVPGLQVPDEEV